VQYNFEVKKMKSGKYTLRELWAESDAEQFVVPELQRDYVWTATQVNSLLNNLFLSHQKYRSFHLPDFKNEELNPSQVNELQKIYCENNCSCNIGFIYAYYDIDVQGRYFLIDGQQRMTTIYLLMAYLAYRDETTREKFTSRYFQSIDDHLQDDDFRNHRLKLDYRVREVAHEFLQHLIFDMVQTPAKNYLSEILFNNQNWEDNEKKKEEKITTTLKKIPWYHLYYRDDVTVRALIANLYAIHRIVNIYRDEKVDFSAWFSYLEDYVEFWYFDTNQSSQGEELYIYMNSRGEQLSYNENRRPDFLSAGDSMMEKEEISREWDGIQNFFWKNRGDNPSADRGFNFFLRLVEQLNIAEHEILDEGDAKYFTDDRVQTQLKNFITRTNSDSISQELKTYYSESKTKEKWDDLLTYSQILRSFATADYVRNCFPNVDSYLQGVIPKGDQRPFLVFAALLIAFRHCNDIDYIKFKRCRLFFENLMRHSGVETEPTIGGRALFSLARHIDQHQQDLYSLCNYPQDNNLLSYEEKNKLQYLSDLARCDATVADSRLQFIDDVLRNDTLLKGKIYLLIYAAAQNDEIGNNPYTLLEDGEMRMKIQNLKEKLHESFKSKDLYNAISFGNCFRFHSVQRTQYPYHFYHGADAWYYNFYAYSNRRDIDITVPNPVIVKFMKNGFTPSNPFADIGTSSVGWKWLQKLFSSEKNRQDILNSCDEKFSLFGEFGDKIYFRGGSPLFSKVCSYADRILFENDIFTRILTMDYDSDFFILAIEGTDDTKRVAIQKIKDGESVWNFDELDAFVDHFKAQGNLDYSYSPVTEPVLH